MSEKKASEPIFLQPGESRVTSAGPVKFKISGTDTGGRYSVMETTQPATPPLHLHHEQDEWFYVLEGEFGFQIGESRLRLGPGGSVLAPRTLPHGYVPLSGGPARLLIMYEPAGQMEAFFAAAFNLAAVGSRPDPAGLAALMAKYRMQVVGPALDAGSFR
jgi:mannose-6-phosphate isomerase-like protein (cupin superfamily)